MINLEDASFVHVFLVGNSFTMIYKLGIPEQFHSVTNTPFYRKGIQALDEGNAWPLCVVFYCIAKQPLESKRTCPNPR